MDTGIYDAVPYPLTTKVTARAGVRTTLLDYFSLLKPRVVLLHLFTAFASMFLAARGVPRVKTLLLVLAGGGLVAGAANALNCYFDRELDENMPRTETRPLPAGRLSPLQSLIFGLACAAVGLSLLAWVSLTAAALAFVAVAFYVMVYTLWLKRNTALSAVLSSGIGAVPPLIGWIAVSGNLALTPFLLFGIIALWTPPHFWALALSRGDEYKRAGLPALPWNRPGLWLVVFIMSLIGATAALVPIARIGAVYTVAAAALGLGYLALSLRPDIERSTRAARRLYVYSIFYLIVLFAAMIISPLI